MFQCQGKAAMLRISRTISYQALAAGLSFQYLNSKATTSPVSSAFFSETGPDA